MYGGSNGVQTFWVGVAFVMISNIIDKDIKYDNIF